MVSNFAFHEKIIIKTDTWVGHLNTVFGQGGGGGLRKKDFEQTSLQKFKRLELLVTGLD